jgi:signal transduction histidine kinase
VRREQGHVVLAVRDDGIGVQEADLPRLFERFYRADRSRHTRGTGLGLAIVKHVIASAGGTVEASGGRGRGLEIRCVLPVEREGARAAPSR